LLFDEHLGVVSQFFGNILHFDDGFAPIEYRLSDFSRDSR